MNFNVKTWPFLWHRFSGISLQFKLTLMVFFAIPITLSAKTVIGSNYLSGSVLKNYNNAFLIQSTDTPKTAAPAKTDSIKTGQIAAKTDTPTTTGTKRVTGTVTDSKGLLLPGVSVKVKGKTTGTITDADGKFSINAAENTLLIFSYLGFSTQEVSVSGKKQLQVKLSDASNSLKEVVVVGYGSQRREELTSAVTEVKAKDFNQGGARNPLDLVQGKVAGLTITRTNGNNPNMSPSIQLRGVTSIVGNNGPLIVIDGIPGGNLALLQQDDIESMSVLKDGSAAAIYGTRANGGVIIVTTKKGKKGLTAVDYSTYFSRDYVLRKPDFLDAAGYRDLIAKGLVNKSNDHGFSTDFYDMLLDKSNLSQYHDIAFSGGGENSTFRASVFYNDLNGIVLQNSSQNYGARLSFTQKAIQGKLNTQINVATNYTKANLLGGGIDGIGGTSFESALVENPTNPLYNPDGTYYEDETYANQIARLNQEKYVRDQQTTSTDVKTTLDIIKGLKASIFGSLQRNSYVDNRYWDVDSRESVKGNIPNGNTAIGGTGYAYKGNYLEKNYAVEPTLEYATVIAKKHNINAIAGYSYQYNVTETYYAGNAGFDNDVFGENNLNAGSFLVNGKATLGSNKEDNKLIAFFGRVNYNYEDKYLAQIVLRHEGSSKFGANHKWGDFPAVSLGWTITKEDFMKKLTFIDNLKLRAGYGITGNQGFPNYQSLVTLNTGNYYVTNISPNGDETWRQTYGPDHNPNPNLRWEKKKELNIGLDFGLFNNKLSGTVDVYNRKTTDLLENYDTQLPPFIQSSIFTNVGSIQNKGVEIAITGQIMNRKDFSWSATVAASTQSNKLLSFSNDTYHIAYREYAGINGNGALGNAIRTVPGGPLGEFFGKRFAGFTPDGDWLFYKADGTKVGPDEITDADKAYIGNGIPKYYASLTNSFRYKNFDLTIFLRGKFGYDILNTTELSYGNKVALPNNVLKSATTTHAELNGSYQYSDYYLENGSFVKVDNVTLGYNFNFKTKYIRTLRVYASGKNLATITGYKGVDPEIEDTGLAPGVENHGVYPRTRTITLGLNVGF